CGSAAMWREFADDLQIDSMDLPGESSAESANAIELNEEVCRYQGRPASLIKNRACGTAAQWVAIDMLHTGYCEQARSTGSFGRFCSTVSLASRVPVTEYATFTSPVVLAPVVAEPGNQRPAGDDAQ